MGYYANQKFAELIKKLIEIILPKKILPETKKARKTKK